MSRAARLALLSWAIAFCFFVAVLFLVLGAPGSPDGAGEAIGRLLAHTGLASLFTWMVVRKKEPAWGAVRFAGLYVAMLVGIAVVTQFGRARAAEPLPFAVEFDENWGVSVEQGVSSAPQDRDLGVRQHAQWTGADGQAAIAFSCMWLTTAPDVSSELRKISDGLVQGMQEQGLVFEPSKPRVLRYGAHDWHEIDGRISVDGETIGKQRLALRTGRRCLLAATFAGTPDAYEQQQPAFEQAIATLREREEHPGDSW